MHITMPLQPAAAAEMVVVVTVVVPLATAKVSRAVASTARAHTSGGQRHSEIKRHPLCCTRSLSVHSLRSSMALHPLRRRALSLQQDRRTLQAVGSRDLLIINLAFDRSRSISIYIFVMGGESTVHVSAAGRARIDSS
jgi:predicted anti-sigma-YlaC factor YlaD